MKGHHGDRPERETITARDPDAPVHSRRTPLDPGTVAEFADWGVWPMDERGRAIPAALASLGEQPNGHDTFVIAKAEAVLTTVRQHVQRFRNSARIEGSPRSDAFACCHAGSGTSGGLNEAGGA